MAEGNPILLGFNVPDIPALEDLFDIQIRQDYKTCNDHAKPLLIYYHQFFPIKQTSQSFGTQMAWHSRPNF